MPLDALEPTWINAPAGVGPAYDSEELRRDMGFLLAGGATAGVSRTGVLDPRALTVTLSGSNVQINQGGAAIATAKGAYLTGATATATIDAVTPADATNPRRDRVVLEILDPDNGGAAGRKAQFRVVTGTPSATATAGGGFPAEPVLALTLAHIDVPKSGNGNPTVTDLRAFSAAAGAPTYCPTQADLDALPKWLGRTAIRGFDKGAITVCDGTIWTRVESRVNVDIALTQAVASTPNTLWGPGSAAQMAAAVVAGKSRNQARFTYPTSNQLQATDEGLYDVTWTVRFFNTDGVTPRATTGFLIIADEIAYPNQTNYGVENFAAVGDVSVSANNITLAALGKLNFNFKVPDAVTAKHWIKVARKG